MAPRSQNYAFLFLALFIVIFGTSLAQVPADQPTAGKRLPALMTSTEYVSLSSDRAIMEVSKEHLETWLHEPNAEIRSTLFLPDYSAYDLRFIAQSIFEPGCKVYCVNGEETSEFTASFGRQFSLWDGDQFKGNFSIFDKEIYGIMYDSPGLSVSFLPQSGRDQNTILCSIQLEYSENISMVSGNCHTDDHLDHIDLKTDLQYRSKASCKRVPISLRADYDLFLKFNRDTQRVVNYLISAFNGVHSLYKKEDIVISLAEIFIHTSEDNFRHVSASEELNAFRTRYRTFAGNVHYLISGFTKNGTAPLGGVAYINTICVKNYAYAYANVNGSFASVPAYSWDILVLTHELGHILGSRHTHACVWGPNKNQAIDNCAQLEGKCSPPPTPSKGTIMSYCHTKGQPGIDFNLGFGPEPGDLIRNTVQSASCLPTYIPSNRTLNQKECTIQANVECSDGSYSHYYFDNHTIDPKDDILILSIFKNGQDIGQISDGSLKVFQSTTASWGSKKGTLITAEHNKNKVPLVVMNKYWNIQSNKKTNGEIRIKMYYGEPDIADLKGSVPNLSDKMFVGFQILPPGNPDPQTNHAHTTPALFKEFVYSSTPAAGKFVIQNEGTNQFSLELTTRDLAGGGIGIYQTGRSGMAGGGGPEDKQSKVSSRNSNTPLFTAAPNPAQGFVVLQGHAPTETAAFIEIIDLQGKIISECTILLGTGFWQKELDLMDIPSGIYCLKLTINSETESKRLIIE